MGTDTTDSNGDFSISAYLTGNTPYNIVVTPNHRWDTGMQEATPGSGNDVELDAVTEKISVFFWATGACNNDDVIDGYADILEENEDYKKTFKFKDSSDVEADCTTVDNWERACDTVFVYIFGHGLNDGSHSHTNFSGYGDKSPVYSNEFRDYMDDWESPRKCILTESCYSGDWADDFDASPYLAMSTSDETHKSRYYTTWEEGKFSYWFFLNVEAGDSASTAFTDASGQCTSPVQNPKKKDNSSYVWFN